MGIQRSEGPGSRLKSGNHESSSNFKFAMLHNYVHVCYITYNAQVYKCCSIVLSRGDIRELFPQLERDMLVWNNKRYNGKPLLVKEDELILKHRRWFSQFYSENSPRFSFKKDDLTF